MTGLDWTTGLPLKFEVCLKLNAVIKMSGSESRPRKVELMCTHSKNTTTTESILYITTKPVFVLNLMTVIFIS